MLAVDHVLRHAVSAPARLLGVGRSRRVCAHAQHAAVRRVARRGGAARWGGREEDPSVGGSGEEGQQEGGGDLGAISMVRLTNVDVVGELEEHGARLARLEVEDELLVHAVGVHLGRGRDGDSKFALGWG